MISIIRFDENRSTIHRQVPSELLDVAVAESRHALKGRESLRITIRDIIEVAVQGVVVFIS